MTGPGYFSRKKKKLLARCEARQAGGYPEASGYPPSCRFGRLDGGVSARANHLPGLDRVSAAANRLRGLDRVDLV